MASQAVAGVGTQFLREDPASPGNYDAIAEINSIDGPGMTRDQIDVTSLDTVGGYREYIPGFRDGGNITLTMNFTSAGYGAMLQDFDADEQRVYRITLPNGEQIDFSGFVSDIPLSITPDDKITQTVTIKISGQVVYSS